ncbi:putative phage protein gp47/JayE [Clostridium saccharoperbutylacetonicum]|uniref:Baseplate J family protein n=2 Tax=Clostridium TaxID=1485 RepID=M1M9C6_9CLOT|nr:baseplate J/gp47 family protein [Clostridium saccharoperbutylacetonicum]AGF54549.1 baseplate J family protein [Clostridium saccharoperbutylacetonicum N1-4(HMT)]NRT58931.1 putative phage protein gp47/JayE [Clostridium saccharoperbutylacetonicum]NSB28119.1 putative phage protein gp47/JayE [Clostridium saccharoperbutylacetonicum]NSB41607.1 putative phage protein gp47/JayE [Clostridium saccharoperbutylacetonicum]
MYENNTEEALRTQMLNAIDSGISKSEGYFVYDAIAPAAKRLAECYSTLDTILKLVFGEPAPEIPAKDYDKFIDEDAARHGLERKQGFYSVGKVTFIGLEGSMIYENSIVQTVEGLKYKVISQGKITDGKCTLEIKAMELGAKYNVPSNSIVQIPIKINGITSVSNLDPTTSGTDTETSEELLKRIITKEREESSSGNIYDYEKWAMEVSGVEYAKVKALWNGNGTVKVIVAGENGAQLDDTIIQKVKAHIDPQDGLGSGKAPIGATVTVVSVMPIEIKVKISGLVIEDKYNLDDVKLNIKKSLEDYLKKVPAGGTVKINAVEAVIVMTEGVNDITSIRINDDTKNITTLDENKAALGGIDYE